MRTYYIPNINLGAQDKSITKTNKRSPPSPLTIEKLSSMKLVPSVRKFGDCCFKVLPK